MFGNIFQKRRSKLDDPIDMLIAELAGRDGGTEEYEKTLSHLERLTELQDKTHSLMPSPDTMAIVAGNLIGIVFILKFEQANVLVSKSLNMLLRTKLDH